MARNPHDTEKSRLDVQRPEDVEYVYRDFFSVFAGQSDVLIELGNVDRTHSGSVRIGNRVVLSLGTAKRLRDTLNQAVAAVEKQKPKS